MFNWIWIVLILFSNSLYSSDVVTWEGSEEAINRDIKLIEKNAKWDEGIISFSFEESGINEASIDCKKNKINILIRSKPEEKTSTLYHALFKMGFLFPHPRWQISPSLNQALHHCGQIYSWRPSFPKRGFHLHTLHPNEWVKGFLEGDNQIAEDTVRWLARNRQNVIDLSLLRPDFEMQINSLNKAFKLAKQLGISRGISLGAAFQQQNSYKLVPILNATTGISDEKALINNTRMLGKKLDYDFMTMEIGTSEFTSMNYERALSWINIVDNELKNMGKKLFTKIHVSTNQVSPRWGNFNFLPRYASRDVGVMPHTVMFYSLEDNYSPVYGNKNFNHMLNFLREEKNKREVWYYPETSYWVGMDMDVPLFLTDYLRARANDMKLVFEEGIEGHFNFSSGQELGNWLFDWNVALLADSDLDFDPLAAIKLLGEDRETWKLILDFQTKHFKDNQLIAILSASNIQDELSSKHRIHKRWTIKEVEKSSLIREEQILRLENALAELPDISNVRNEELKKMLEINDLRIMHALMLRKSMRFLANTAQRNNFLDQAAQIRQKAYQKINSVIKLVSRYPESKLFEKDNNLTSYDFGYLWSAANLHFWKREEMMLRNDNYSPFYLNIYNLLDIIF
jgi:hypothetical protein